MDSTECLVVGAGVVGLAIARALALAGYETIVVEAEGRIGSGISSRNSEVIHAGIYYPPGSLKARLCVEGRRHLYEYCQARAIPHRRCGKLIVATTDDQIDDLEQLLKAAHAAGVDDIRRLAPSDIQSLEPALHIAGALHSPSTGIIDAHAYMLALQGDAEVAGAMIAFGTRLSRMAIDGAGLQICFNDEAVPSLRAGLVVNAAGLAAQSVALSLSELPRQHVPPLYYAKGNYFSLTGGSPFRHLIYPIPEPGGLGTHLTLDLNGRARFGPDVEWIDTPDFQVDPARSHSFYQAIRRYWPDLRDGALSPDYAGIRPKLTAPGTPAADFIISGPAEHGVAGLINLFGIESPGLTASLAIAALVARIASNQG